VVRWAFLHSVADIDGNVLLISWFGCATPRPQQYDSNREGRSNSDEQYWEPLHTGKTRPYLPEGFPRFG